jgi:hypothetical protein
MKKWENDMTRDLREISHEDWWMEMAQDCAQRQTLVLVKLNFQVIPVFHNLFSPAAHLNLSKTHDGTPQNVAS